MYERFCLLATFLRLPAGECAAQRPYLDELKCRVNVTRLPDVDFALVYICVNLEPEFDTQRLGLRRFDGLR